MTEIHVPHLDEHDEAPTVPHEEHGTATPQANASPPLLLRPNRGKAFVRVALEVVLISLGVFLGLMGEQWRESAHRRALAVEALHRFRTEIQANRKAVLGVKDYHVATQQAMQAFLASGGKTPLHVRGLQPAFFEHSAWDLALATQSLSDIDSQLAFSISRIYTLQQTYSELARGILQAMYLRPPDRDMDAFVSAAVLFYGDVILYEPALLHMYDDVLPRIDRALGEAPPTRQP